MKTPSLAQEKLGCEENDKVAAKTVAFLPGHPAQLWFMRQVEQSVARFARTQWILRDKDCELSLAESMGLQYTVISKAATGILGNAATLAADTVRAIRLTRRLGIDLWITKYGAANIAARLLGRKSLAFNDDDADVVPLIAWSSYPFANCVAAPAVTRMGRFAHKTIRFDGNFELAYLHPDRFVPDQSILAELGVSQDEPFAVIRLSALQAHHDVGIKGLGESLLRKILRLLDGKIRPFISSEKPLGPEFESFRFPIPPHRMHHALAFAEFFLGDSQTMTSEAAVLGTPALRINDFVGRLSYLEELQDAGLTFGFRPAEERPFLDRLAILLDMPNRKAEFQARRQQFLAKKIDPVPWFADVICNLCQDTAPQVTTT